MTRVGFRRSKWKHQREYGAVYDENGRLVSEIFAGTHGHVIFDVPDDFIWEDKRALHTHPSDFGGTFSPEDIFHLTDGNLLSYDAACTEETYVIERSGTPGQEVREALNNDFSAQADLSNEDRYFEVLEKYLGSGLDPYGDDAESFEHEVKHLVSSDLDAWLKANAVKKTMSTSS